MASDTVWATDFWSTDFWADGFWAGFTTAVTPPAGGFMMAFEGFRERRDTDDERRKKKIKDLEFIESEVDREIAQLLHQDAINAAREQQLKELEALVVKNARDFRAEKAHNAKVVKAFVRAELQRNFSALEALERELERSREEEMFLLLAIAIFV